MTQTDQPIVDVFHEILIWPLELAANERARDDGFYARRLADRLVELHRGGPWQMQDDVLGRGTTSDKDVQYAEFVYFHPFVQRVLYPASGEKAPALVLLSRDDIGAVNVKLHGHGKPIELDVLRLHFYIFRSQTALLVVEVRNREPLPLKTVQDFADQFRQAYAPYHWNGRAGHCADSIEWLDAARTRSIGDASDYSRKRMHGCVFGDPEKPRTDFERREPVSPHWKSLLPDLESLGVEAEQLEDDRMPTMLYVGIQDPFSVSRGDFMRLCFCDGSGNPADTPYAPAFLADFETRFCYDRFWNPPPEEGPGLLEIRRKNEWRNTRYLCSGYNFVAVTNPCGYGKEILDHFRHHYFQLGLLAHFHRASMLKYSRRLTDAARQLTEASRRDHSALLRVRRDFADFVNDYWFREVSNQEQAKELFKMWSDRLGNCELLEQLDMEAAAVDRILNQDWEKEQQGRMHEIAASTDRLTRALFWLTGFALVVAFLDTELLRTAAQWSGSWLFKGSMDDHLWFWLPLLAWTFIGALVGYGLLVWRHRKLFADKKSNAPENRSR